MKDYDYPKNTLLDLIKKGFKSLYFANKVANNGVLFWVIFRAKPLTLPKNGSIIGVFPWVLKQFLEQRMVNQVQPLRCWKFTYFPRKICWNNLWECRLDFGKQHKEKTHHLHFSNWKVIYHYEPIPFQPTPYFMKTFKNQRFWNNTLMEIVLIWGVTKTMRNLRSCQKKRFHHIF